MTNEAPNHVTAEVDQALPRRTKDGVRLLVTLGFPFKSNKAVALALMEQIGNPLDVDFTMIQACLQSAQAASKTVTGPNQDVPTVTVKTTVDGVEAEVILPVREGGRRNAILPHPFKADANEQSDNYGKCVYCKHGEAYTAHDQARIDAAARAEREKAQGNGHKSTRDELTAEGEAMHQRHVEAYKTPHAFEPRTQDDCCDACGHPGADDVHQPSVEVESIPEHLQNGNGATGNHSADALIAQAQETEAVPSA